MKLDPIGYWLTTALLVASGILGIAVGLSDIFGLEHHVLEKAPLGVLMSLVGLVAFSLGVERAVELRRHHKTLQTLSITLETKLPILEERLGELKLMWDLLANQLDVSSIQLFSDAELAQEALKNIALQNNKPTKAHIIHYSGQNVHSTVLALQRIPQINQIHVLLQHPENAINPSQISKIKIQLETIPFHWDSTKVRVSYYHEPASVRGILLENVALCIGWYVYENAKPSSSGVFVETHIWGHNTGAILVRSDSKAFAALCDFFMRTFGYLDDEAVSMDELRKNYQ